MTRADDPNEPGAPRFRRPFLVCGYLIDRPGYDATCPECGVCRADYDAARVAIARKRLRIVSITGLVLTAASVACTGLFTLLQAVDPLRSDPAFGIPGLGWGLAVAGLCFVPFAHQDVNFLKRLDPPAIPKDDRRFMVAAVAAWVGAIVALFAL